MQPPGGSWAIVWGYSTSSTFTWNGAGTAGPYSFAVWVLAPGSSGDYDAYLVTPFTLS
jgi:hypothetical protein